MTRSAIYHATPNHIVEEPTMEKPYAYDIWLQFKEEGGVLVSDDHVIEAIKEYDNHLATLRTIPAHDSARSLWKDGQKLVDGKDYEVREEPIPYFDHIDDPVEYRTRAYPIVPVKSEDDLWKEFMDDIWDMTGISLFERTMTMAKIQQKYIITKR